MIPLYILLREPSHTNKVKSSGSWGVHQDFGSFPSSRVVTGTVYDRTLVVTGTVHHGPGPFFLGHVDTGEGPKTDTELTPKGYQTFPTEMGRCGRTEPTTNHRI